jgi:hypothetical protein
MPGSWSLSDEALTIQFAAGELYHRLLLPPAAGMRRAQPSESEVVFRYRSTTGEFVCYGASKGNGTSGVTVFEPSESADEELLELFPHRNSLETAVMLGIGNVSLDLARSLSFAFPQIDPEDVSGFALLGVSPEYVQAITTTLPDTSRAGVKALFMNEVTPEYIAALHEAMVRDINWRSVVELHKAGVKSEFVSELRVAGYKGAFADELVMLQLVGCDIDFIKRNIRSGAARPSLFLLAALASRRK